MSENVFDTVIDNSENHPVLLMSFAIDAPNDLQRRSSILGDWEFWSKISN
jgi:hypothetical protein